MTDLWLTLATNVKLILAGLCAVVLLACVIVRRRVADPFAQSRKLDVLAGATLVVYAVLLVALGVRHQGLTDYSVEWDFAGYALRAQSLRDVFAVSPRTPYGYPLLLWFVTLFSGNVFISAKIVAGLSTLASVGLVYLLGKRLFDAHIALLATLAVLGVPVFANHSMLVGTDMPALAFLLGSLVFLVASPARSWWSIAAAGAVGGMSYLVRPSGLVLLPAVMFWMLGLHWAESSVWKARRLWTAVAYGLGFVLMAFPHLLLNTIHTGNPFYNDRAVDMWLDMYGNWDFTLMPQVQGITIGEVVSIDPLGFVLHWGQNLLESLKVSPLPWPLALFAIPGVLALPFRGRRPELGLFYWYGLGHLALLATAWSTAKLVRVFLPLAPLLALIAVWLFCCLNPLDVRLGRFRLPWREPLFLAGLLVTLWSQPYYAPFLEPGLERPHSFVRPAVETSWQADLEGKARLLGYALEPKVLGPGETLHLTLYWQALLPGSKDYTVFVHILDRDGHMWAGQDNWPQGGAFPTSLWMSGEFVTDRYEIALPADIPEGDYRVEVGMYLLETMERLQVTGVDGVPQGTSVVLPGFQVETGITAP